MSLELATGMQVGRYQLLFRLGKGGMGEVWAARQASTVAVGFRKIVALKVLHSPELTSNAALMFLDEAKAASVLQHPAVVTTVDLGREGELLYIAMDLVQGPSLTALLQRLVVDRARMPYALVTYLGSRLASALDYAHARALYQGRPLNLVHRDVSPHNVLLDMHSGEVRLTDFGVARTSIQDHESRVGTVRGKPSYMAPEQVVGGEIDQRTDIFALGIVLYETASLKRLFGRQNPIKSMDAVLKHEPVPLTELVDGFPPALWAVVAKALEKDPEARWSTAGQMREALLDCGRGLGASTVPGHDLVRLIERHFEPGAFDLEARLRELEAQGDMPAEPTTAVLDERDPAQEATVAPTSMHWPYAIAEDPLAPEAVEAARTRFQRPPPPSASPALMATMVGARSSSASGSIPSMVRTRPRGRLFGPTLFLALATVMLASVLAWLVTRPRPTAAIPPLPPARPVPKPVAETQPRPVPQPVAEAQPQPVVQAQPRAAEASPPAAEPPSAAAQKSAPKAPRKSRARSVVKRRSSRSSGRSPKPRRTRTPREDVGITYEEVHGLLMRVKALDDVKGTAMIVTLAEAGRNNPTALARLHRQAKEFLRSRGRTD